MTEFNKAKSILIAEVRKLRGKAEMKRRESKALDQQADEIEKQIAKIK